MRYLFLLLFVVGCTTKPPKKVVIPPPPKVIEEAAVVEEPPPPPEKVYYAKSSTLEPIYFGFDSFEMIESLSAGFAASFILERERLVRVDLEGHACTIGPQIYNDSLSKNRANAVKAYFIFAGIPKEKINVSFFGESECRDEVLKKCRKVNIITHWEE